MKRFFLACIMVLCVGGIAAGVFAMTAPLFFPQNAASSQSAYELRDTGGRVAVYAAGSDTPLAVYDIYVNLLPEGDALRLKSGMRVYGDTALESLLEDLGA
ncbi:MAG: hypothetical protein LKJ90_05505 [Faecalibacterium sp.]|jgi:ABC-type phosphate transport system substrate-binding protein|nr:hypothetical protein [Faecalibacterium sp.]